MELAGFFDEVVAAHGKRRDVTGNAFLRGKNGCNLGGGFPPHLKPRVDTNKPSLAARPARNLKGMRVASNPNTNQQVRS